MKHITIGNTQLKNVEDMLCEIDDYEYPGEEVEIDDNSIIPISSLFFPKSSHKVSFKSIK